ncbi:hypothetical protein L208DRAFT_1397567 [Tricholoma matsutake]|nr:hypothetical protein L208DRAFT_1397567 [Tricholoma matsutake 945]
MSHIPMPMNAAHQHAANAEDHIGNGLLIPAAEEHAKAAEAYFAALERSNDESAKRTLRLLYNEHCKAEKELQRKIAKLKEEGKDPSLPQKLERPQSAATRPSAQAYPAIPRSVPSPPSSRQMTDSQNTVDESFMLLAGQRSDPGDAFNQFWTIMQGMLDNLSQPVAFATVPLGDAALYNNQSQTPSSSRRDAGFGSDTDTDEPVLARLTRRIGITIDGRTTARDPPESSSYKGNEDLDSDVFDEGNELSESFYLIPSGRESSSADLKQQNAQLRLEIEAMQKRLETTERILQLRKEQDLQLRDSIFQATREAQRAMGASMMAPRPGGLDISSLNSNLPPIAIPGINSAREAQYARRIKELEEEFRILRAENEKNKAMIVKFRERWDKLKESAKRKKAKAAAGTTTASVGEKIVEEPEAEEELDA